MLQQLNVYLKKKKICDIYLPLYTKINFKRIICCIQKLTLKGPYTELQVKIMEIMSLAQRALPGSHSESQRKSSFSGREKGKVTIVKSAHGFLFSLARLSLRKTILLDPK